MKKTLATITAGLALSGMTAIGLTAAFASPAGAATPSTVASVPATVSHPLRAWLRAHRRTVARHVTEISAKTIGITPESLVGALRSGQSIAQVAQAHGVEVQTVADALVQAGDTHVVRAVANHKLTPAQGTRIEAALPGVVDKILGHVYGQHAG